jgi:hypothetical protein
MKLKWYTVNIPEKVEWVKNVVAGGSEQGET